MAQAKPSTFETAFGSYQRVRQIGAGGSGTVVEAKDADGAPVAIKYLSPVGMSSDKLKRFKNELNFCSRCSHPNVIQVLDWGSVDVGGTKAPFYVMPLYASSLRDLIKTGIAADATLPLFSQLLDGLEAAHLMGVFHRDVKPENVLFSTDDSVLAVADFGIAHFEADTMLTLVETKQASRMANFQYAAPEQRIRGAAVDQRADIYALGLILSEMFTGRPPLGLGFTKIAEVSTTHAFLDPLVESMLMQDLSSRPQSIGEVKRALIARGEAYVREQKLSELKQQVVPKAQVDDAIVDSPPEIVDVRWENEELAFTLSTPVNGEWVELFRNPGDCGWIQGFGPERYEIRGTVAKIRGVRDGSLAQRLIPYAKQYVQKANLKYGQMLEAQASERQRREEAALRAKIELEERTRKINESLEL